MQIRDMAVLDGHLQYDRVFVHLELLSVQDAIAADSQQSLGRAEG